MELLIPVNYKLFESMGLFGCKAGVSLGTPTVSFQPLPLLISLSNISLSSTPPQDRPAVHPEFCEVSSDLNFPDCHLIKIQQVLGIKAHHISLLDPQPHLSTIRYFLIQD